MSMVDDLFLEACELPVKEQKELLRQLLQSLELPVPPDEGAPASVRVAWKKDVMKRLDEMVSSRVKTAGDRGENKPH